MKNVESGGSAARGLASLVQGPAPAGLSCPKLLFSSHQGPAAAHGGRRKPAVGRPDTSGRGPFWATWGPEGLPLARGS